MNEIWTVHELRDLWALQEQRRSCRLNRLRGLAMGVVACAVAVLVIVALLTW